MGRIKIPESFIIIGLSLSAQPLNQEFNFSGNGTSGPYQLPARFIIANSDSVIQNGEYLPRDQYRLNYQTGEIVFLQTLPESVRVFVYYQQLPFLLAPAYRHKVPVPKAAPALEAPEPKPQSPEGETNLSASGYKTVGVNFGRQTPVALEQSLQLNLKGDLAGLALEAYLSDQQTPIPPEGTTRELSQLDQVLINLKGKGLSGSLGDCEFSLPLAQFGTIERRLAGGLAVFNFKGLKINLADARSKGRFTINRFPGEEGKQGPYRLTGSEAGITVVPASERVFLDGERMERGWDADYVIDYSAAEVTFTNRRLITNRSRIEIEFEYTTESFERFTYNVGGCYDFAPVQFGVQLFQEADDQNRSLQTELTPSQRAQLAQIGDDTAQAWVSGVSYVGPGKGQYAKENDHFRFMGLNGGDYNVTFSYVGDNRGDYNYDNAIGGFSYIGPGKGLYLPKIYIDLPKKNELLLTTLKLHTPLGLLFDVTGLATRTDKNLFSDLDDTDNTGLGYALSGGFEYKPLTISYERTLFSQNLWLAPRTEDVDFQHKWGITPLTAERSIDELKLNLKLLKDLILNLGTGLITTSQFQVKRGYFDGRFRNSHYSVQFLKNGVYHNFGLSEPICMFVPQFWFRQESSDTSRVWDWLLGMELTPKKPLAVGLSYERREGNRYDSLWLKESRAETYRLRVNTRSLGGINLGGVIGFYKNHYLQVEGNDYENFFSNLRSSYTHLKGITLRLDLDQTRKQTQGQVINYIKVADGTGDYSRDPVTGNFYPDPEGDYIRQTLPTGRPIPAQELNLNSSLDLSFLRPVGFSGFYTLRENRGDTSVLRKTENYDLNLTLFPYESNFSLSVLNSGNKFQDALSSEPTTDIKISYGVEVRSATLDPVFLKTRAELNRENRERIGFGQEKNLIEQQIAFEPTINLKFNLLVRLGFSHKSIELPLYYPLLGRFPLDRRNLGLGIRWSGIANTIVGINFDLNYRTSTISQLPYELELMEPLGFTHEWQLSGDRSLTDELTLSIQYRGLARPDRPVDHSFSCNLRAYF